MVQKGAKDGWLKIKKSSTISITKGLKVEKENKKEIKTPVQDEFTIGGFKACRTSKFENKSSLNLERKSVQFYILYHLFYRLTGAPALARM